MGSTCFAWKDALGTATLTAYGTASYTASLNNAFYTFVFAVGTSPGTAEARIDLFQGRTLEARSHLLAYR